MHATIDQSDHHPGRKSPDSVVLAAMLPVSYKTINPTTIPGIV